MTAYAQAQSAVLLPSFTEGLTLKFATGNQVVKNPGPAGEYRLSCYNPNGTVAFVQVYNVRSPTIGTTVPLQSIAIPSGLTGGFVMPLAEIYNGPGQSIAATTTPTGGTAPGTALPCTVALK